MKSPIKKIVSSMQNVQTGLLLSFSIIVFFAFYLSRSSLIEPQTSRDLFTQVEESSKPQAESDRGPQPKHVHALLLRLESIRNEIVVYGKTGPNRIVLVKSEAERKVEKLFIKKGDKIRSGETIAILDQGTLSSQTNAANARFALRESEYLSAISLNKNGHITKNNLAHSKSNLADAEERLASVRQQVKNTKINAPFDGILNDRFVEVGDYLKKGDVVAEVLDLDPLKVIVNVNENQANRLRVGQLAQVEFTDNDDCSAVVEYIGSNAIKGTNTYPVELTIENTDNRLLSGMNVSVSLFTTKEDAVKVSPAYITISDKGIAGIFVIDENQRANFVEAKVIKSDTQYVWIKGVKNNSRIVTQGYQTLRDGDLVVVENQVQRYPIIGSL